MSGMLSGGFGGGMGQGLGSLQSDSIDPTQILQMLQASNKDPFSRSLPGEGLLGQGGMGLPQMPGLAQQQQNNPQQGMGAPQMPGMSTISTDFTGTQPGLPNLPDSFLGFGYGQFAPQEVKTGQGSQGGMPGGMRQQMIMQMLQHLMPQLQAGGQDQMSGGMGGF